MKDGSTLQPDAIICCTGYRYVFPFLDESVVTVNEDEIVSPLYKHLVHITLPRLFFVGIPKKICPFPLFDCQIKLVVSLLSGRVSLPSEAAMFEDMRSEQAARLNEGMPARYAHTMGGKQWPYNDDLADLGDFQQIPRVIQTLYEAVHVTRTSSLPTYKNKRYELIDENDFKDISTS